MLEESVPPHEAAMEQWLDLFFHGPTIVLCMIGSLFLLWNVYDMGLTLGEGFLRMNSNHGQLLLYWVDGCCQLQW